MIEGRRPGEEDLDRDEVFWRSMPNPIVDPWAWLSEGLGIAARLRRGVSKTETISHPEPVPPPPGPRSPNPEG